MRDVTLERHFLAFRERGSPRALARVFDALAPDLLALARHLAPSADRAEDLVQGTFLALLERPGGWDATRPLRAYAFGLLAHLARAARRDAARSVEPERLVERRAGGPLEQLTEGELAEAVELATRRLPGHHAAVLQLHLIEGLRPREIAQRLGLTGVAARTRLHRALRRLRALLPPGLALGAMGTLSVQSHARQALPRLRAQLFQAAGTSAPATSLSAVQTASTLLLMKKPLAVLALVAALGLALYRFAAAPEAPSPVAGGPGVPEAVSLALATASDESAGHAAEPRRAPALQTAAAAAPRLADGVRIQVRLVRRASDESAWLERDAQRSADANAEAFELFVLVQQREVWAPLFEQPVGTCLLDCDTTIECALAPTGPELSAYRIVAVGPAGAGRVDFVLPAGLTELEPDPIPMRTRLPLEVQLVHAARSPAPDTSLAGVRIRATALGSDAWPHAARSTWPAALRRPLEAVTDANGLALFELPADASGTTVYMGDDGTGTAVDARFRLECALPEPLVAWPCELELWAEEPLIGASKVTLEVTGTETLAVRGRVLDLAGDPVAGAAVGGSGWTRGRWRPARPDGSFELSLGELLDAQGGNWRWSLRAGAPGHADGSVPLSEAEFELGSSAGKSAGASQNGARRIEFRLAPTMRVAGQVLDGLGNGVEGVEVLAMSERGGFSLRTDAAGRFDLPNIARGPATLQVIDAPARFERPASLRIGPGPGEHRIVLAERLTASARFELRAALDGAELQPERAALYAVTEGDRALLPVTVVGRAEIWMEPRYEADAVAFDALELGRYELFVAAVGGLVGRFSFAVETPGEAVTRRLELGTVARLELRVRTPAGQSIEPGSLGARISHEASTPWISGLADFDPLRGRDAKLDPGASTLVEGLASGTWIVEIPAHDADSLGCAPQAVQLGPDELAFLTLDALPAAGLRLAPEWFALGAAPQLALRPPVDSAWRRSEPADERAVRWLAAGEWHWQVHVPGHPTRRGLLRLGPGEVHELQP